MYKNTIYNLFFWCAIIHHRICIFTIMHKIWQKSLHLSPMAVPFHPWLSSIHKTSCRHCSIVLHMVSGPFSAGALPDNASGPYIFYTQLVYIWYCGWQCVQLWHLRKCDDLQLLAIDRQLDQGRRPSQSLWQNHEWRNPWKSERAFVEILMAHPGWTKQ